MQNGSTKALFCLKRDLEVSQVTKSTTSLEKTILDLYDTMSRTQRTVARQILMHPMETLTLSLNEMASKTSTSRATILRFCQMLGLDGFHELKQLIGRRAPEDRGNSMLQWCALVGQRCVTETFGVLDVDQFQEVCQTLASKRRLVWYGAGESGFLAEIGNHKCMHLGIDSLCSKEASHFLGVAPALNSDHAAIIISQSGDGSYSPVGSTYLEGPVQQCRQRGVFTVAITSNPLSWLGRHADEVLFAQSQVLLTKGNPVVIKAGFEALVSTLAIEVGLLRGAELQSEVRKL